VGDQGTEFGDSPNNSPGIQGVWGLSFGLSFGTVPEFGENSLTPKENSWGCPRTLLLFVFGSGVALVGVQLTEYPKLFLSRWIRVPDLIGDEHLKTGVLLDFLNLGTGM